VRKNQAQKIGLTFLIIFALPLFVPIIDTLAITSTSTNYQIDGGQVAPLYGSGGSGSFSIETGGNPISGISSSSNYQVQQGAPLDPATGVVSTTTPEEPPVPGGGGFPTPLALNVQVINITHHEAEIIFDTNTGAAFAYIEYGTFGDYNFRTIEDEPGDTHRFLLTGLTPGTLYNFRIHLEITPNRVNTMGPYFFATQPIISVVPNVTNLTITPTEESMFIKWLDPLFNEYARTIVVKKISSYPKNVFDGTIIFSGTVGNYTDSDVVPNTKYHYTVFVETVDGKFSSGVTKSATLGEGITPTEPPPLPPGITPTPETGLQEDIVNIFTLLRQNVAKEHYELIKKFGKLPQGSIDEVNKIKEGLINEHGGFQLNLFEILTPPEREQLEKTLQDTLPERFDEEVINTVTPVSLVGAPGIDWKILTNSDVLLKIQHDIFLKAVEKITVTISDQTYVLKYNTQSDSYEALIRSPKTGGIYQSIVQIIYTDNTYEEVDRTVQVDSYGTVYYRKHRPWSWKKPWQFLFTDKVMLEEALVTLETISREKNWITWPSNLHSQFNPILTDENGEYAFVVPDGLYQLKIELEGFKSFKSKKFDIDRQVVNIDAQLRHKLSTLWIIILLIIAIIIAMRVVATREKRDKEDGEKQRK